ncbi:MAG: germination protein YpeB [Bacillota bacterium]
MRRSYTALMVVLAGALLLTGVWGYSQHRTLKMVAINTENNYQRSFYEMVNHTENLEVALAKSLASSSPKGHSWTGTDIWRQAYAAGENLAQLPVSQVPLMRTAKFYNQMGDFAFVLTTQSKSNQLSPEDRKTLEGMHQEVVFLNAELKKIGSGLSSGRFRWMGGSGATQRLDKTAMKLAVSGFNTVENRLVKYPSLTYDGAFSDHMLVTRPIQGRTVSPDEAAAIARSFLGISGSDTKVSVVGKVLGTVPAYQIQAMGSKNTVPVTHVEVTQAGGHVTWMLKRPPGGNVHISTMEAQQKAMTFLEQRGFRDMVITGYQKMGNELVVALARQKGRVLYYPSTVKVKVGLGNGEITGYDARGSIIGNNLDQLPQPKLTVEEARRKVSPALKITTEKLAVIPTEAGKELLAYEFKGTYKGLVFLVYINALTGEEERILQVVERKGEVLTM